MDKSSIIDNIYFILSGVFAVFLYILMLFFLIFLFRVNQIIHLSIDNPSKISGIEVDLVNDALEKNTKIVETKTIPETPKKYDKSSHKEIGSKSPITGLGAGDLFEKVDTKNPNPKIKETISDNKDKIALNRKSEETINLNKQDKLNKILQSTQNLTQTLQNLNQNISIEDSSTSQFCNTYRDYCNELAEILYSNWSIKNSFDEILSSVVIIKINKNGDFSYTIKRLSNNDKFDTDLKESLDKLRNVKFPTIDGIKFDKLEVIFKNKKGE